MAEISFRRKTVSRDVRLEGLGLHSGVPVEVTLRSGESGIRFRYDGRWVAATPENVTDTTRSTSLGEVRTIEHLMSACSGMGITDVDVHLSTPELPAMDGSAGPFCAALEDAGVVDLGVRSLPFPEGGVAFEDGPVSIRVVQGSGLWQYHYVSDRLWPKDWVVNVDLGATQYATSVAMARTFLHEEELAELPERGMAQGLDASQALIIGSKGPLTAERMPYEKVTHKLLDLMGDLYLAGIPAKYLDVQARRSGHRTNTQCALKMAAPSTPRP